MGGSGRELLSWYRSRATQDAMVEKYTLRQWHMWTPGALARAFQEPPPCWRQLRIQFAKYSTQEFNWIFCGFATFLKRIRQRVFRGKNFRIFIFEFSRSVSWVILIFWKCEAEYASVWLRHPYWRESSFRDLPKHVSFPGGIASFYAFYLRQIREFDLSVACNLRLFLDLILYCHEFCIWSEN